MISRIQMHDVLLAAAVVGLVFSSGGLSPQAARAQEDKKDPNSRILFVSDRDQPQEYAVYAMNPDGSGQTRLSKGPGIAFDPAWSPDRKRILYSFVAGKDMPKSDLMVMKADGSEPTRLITGEEKTVLLSPSWSPDAKHISYISIIIGNGKPEPSLYVAEADGKNPRKFGNGICASWSPDSKHILFSPMLAQGGAPELKIMDADGTNVKPLPTKGLGPVFSPDGKRIAFTSEGDNQPNVFIMDADASHITRLTKDADTLAIGPVWTSDGKHILFTKAPKVESDHLSFQICSMDADGSNVKVLTKEGSFLGVGPSLFLLMRHHGE